jgi:GT2 family glycosyltransferase
VTANGAFQGAKDSSPCGYVSVVVPTRNHADALRQCLNSLLEQDYPRKSFEIVVVDNGSTDDTPHVVMESAEESHEHPPVRFIRHETRGLNRARNAGINAALGNPICFVDDDVVAPPGWLSAMVAGFEGHADAGCFGGPIRLLLEGKVPRMCGREPLGETELELGKEERAVDTVWGANMAITRTALTRCGPFDERFEIYGDEEEWERRLISKSGSVIYLPHAWLWHRRTSEELRLRNLIVSRFRRGRHGIRAAKLLESQISVKEDLRAGFRFLLHGFRRQCAWGFLAASCRLGRIYELIADDLVSMSGRTHSDS